MARELRCRGSVRFDRLAPAAPALVLSVLTVGASWLASSEAEALPRFATRNGTHCWTCHVNPTGGGMRNEYGRNAFELGRLAFPPTASLAAGATTKAAGLLAALSENPSFGIDSRVAYLWVRAIDDPTGDPVNVPVDGFFQMQADFYARMRLGDWAELYLDAGVSSGFETFVLLHWEQHLYLKAGRFVPPYGLKLDSHTTWIRDRNGMGPGARDTGVEVGALVGPLQISAMVARAALSSDRTSKGFGVSALAYLAGHVGPLRYQLGVSFAHRPTQASPISGIIYTTLDVSAGLRESLGGAFLGLALGRLSYLFEADVALTRENAAEGARTLRTVTAYHELALLVVQGIDVAGIFEYWEPDLDVRTGAAWRAGGFIEFFPLPLLELRIMYRHTRAPRLTVDGEDDVVVMLHGFF